MKSVCLTLTFHVFFITLRYSVLTGCTKETTSFLGTDQNSEYTLYPEILTWDPWKKSTAALMIHWPGKKEPQGSVIQRLIFHFQRLQMMMTLFGLYCELTGGWAGAQTKRKVMVNKKRPLEATEESWLFFMTTAAHFSAETF